MSLPRNKLIRGTSPADIAAAAERLRSGGLVAFPTETVYGLGADATDDAAVAGIFEAKGRPSFNPLISHVADVAAARALAIFNPDAGRLAAAFWPGPLTLVLPARPDCPVSLLARAGLDTIALRAPSHPVALALLRAVGRPVAAPSANRSGHVSATSADHVLADLDGRIDMILDGGTTPVGIESTVVACLDGETALLRAGGVSRTAIEAALGRPLARAGEDGGEAPLSPGRLLSHYAPRARVRLEATDLRPGEAALDFGGQLPSAGLRFDISPGGNLAEAAANLFAALRALDAAGPAMIAVASVPEEGLGEAINDRLRRAAAAR